MVVLSYNVVSRNTKATTMGMYTWQTCHVQKVPKVVGGVLSKHLQQPSQEAAPYSVMQPALSPDNSQPCTHALPQLLSPDLLVPRNLNSGCCKSDAGVQIARAATSCTWPLCWPGASSMPRRPHYLCLVTGLQMRQRHTPCSQYAPVFSCSSFLCFCSAQALQQSRVAVSRAVCASAK